MAVLLRLFALAVHKNPDLELDCLTEAMNGFEPSGRFAALVAQAQIALFALKACNLDYDG